MAIAAPASAPDGTLTGFEAQQGLNTLESPSSGSDGIAGDICPAATDNPLINLQNRRDAIETGRFGPLDPSLPNNEYWQEAAAEWNASIEFVKHARCGNCAAFNITTAMRECIRAGSQSLDAWVLVKAGQLGYCEVFDFRCAAKRRCNMWVAGGPLTDDLAQQFTGYDYELEEYKSDAALFKFNPSHDSAGRFSSGSSSGGGNGFAKRGALREVSGLNMTQHDKYLDGLSGEGQEAVSAYAGPGYDFDESYTAMNAIVQDERILKRALDGDPQAYSGLDDATAIALGRSAALQQAIAGAPPIPETVVYRGLDGKTSADRLLGTSSRGQAEEGEEGRVITMRGFASTSTDPFVAAEFAGQGSGAGKPYILEIKTNRGLLIDKFAGLGQSELLLPAHAKYQVVGRTTGKFPTGGGDVAEFNVIQLEFMGGATKSLKFNPNHDASGRFSSGGGGGNSAAARAGKLAKELESKLGDKSGPPHGFAADGARRTDDTDEDEENAHYDYIRSLPSATQEAIDRYVQHSDGINGLLRDKPQIFELARDMHASGESDIPAAASIAVQAAGFKRGTPEFAEAFGLTKDAVRIDKAIAEAPPIKERVVLRGLQGTNTTLDVIVDRANSDGVVKLKGIASSTTDPSVANRFTLGDAGTDKPFVMEIRTKRGLLVEGVSNQGEQEMLLRPNANYKILGTGTGKFSSLNAAKEIPTLQLQLLSF